jgi:hypothetical protein
LLHADEKKINVRDKGGFVWVFANMEEVAYVYSETREGDLLHTMLKDFKGVLVCLTSTLPTIQSTALSKSA